MTAITNSARDRKLARAIAFEGSRSRNRDIALALGTVRGYTGAISFSEDERRIRKGHRAENFSRLCRIGLNLLKNEKTQKTGIAIKRQKCGWDDDYLLKVLAA